MELKLISGLSNQPLANEISNKLNCKLVDCSIGTFSDGEISIEINENVRGCDVFIIQSISYPSSYNLMQLLVLNDALKRASARRITSVIPYFGFARQDRKVKPRVPITAKLVANLITISGSNRVITMDLHSGQIQGFFDIPVDNLISRIKFIEYIKENIDINNLVIVSPDSGGVERARSLAKRLDSSLVIIDKRREKANECEILNVIGNVENKDCIIIDDMIDTAGTITNVAKTLKEKNAKNIYAFCTHAVLSGKAIERINNSEISKLVTTNTINKDIYPNTTDLISVADIFSQAIYNVHTEQSINSLFK